MHTTQSYAVFPFSVFSREHWFIIWTTFSIKAAKQSQQRRVWKEIDQLIASKVWIFHKKREPEPEDKGHPNKWSAAMRTPQTQGKMGRRMSSYGYRENRELDSTQNVPWSPVKTQPNHSCQMRWRYSEHTEHCWYEECAAEFTLPQTFTPYRAKPSLLVPLRCHPNLWKPLCYVRDPQIALLLPWLQIWLRGEQQL